MVSNTVPPTQVTTAPPKTPSGYDKNGEPYYFLDVSENGIDLYVDKYNNLLNGADPYKPAEEYMPFGTPLRKVEPKNAVPDSGEWYDTSKDVVREISGIPIDGTTAATNSPPKRPTASGKTNSGKTPTGYDKNGKPYYYAYTVCQIRVYEDVHGNALNFPDPYALCPVEYKPND
jgi:hypothetical protein